MFKRYLYTFLGIVSLLGVYWLALLPVLAVRTGLEAKQYVIALIIWGVLAAVFLVPGLAAILKSVWFFRGSGEPVVLDLLHSVLMKVNDIDAPVTVRRQGKKLVCTWRCHEPHWCERLEKSGMRRLYELWLRFDNSTKTVIMTDRYRSINWDLSPVSVKTGWLSWSRPFFKVQTGDQWGMENYEDGVPEEYTFSPNEIKSPVMNTILKNGWNVRFSLF
ncbi:MAG TPA: hypothetical protein ENN06_02780 [Desulfobacteraceae bacterium]|nr:hypothetical protein [Desulfobacteraceae bacterium]